MPAESPKRLALSRAQRLKQGRDFTRVRQEGQRAVLGCLIANWRRLPAGATTRLGVVTSRKIGGAVVRNRARRLMREVFRLHQRELTEPVELVLVARQSIAGRGRAAVEKDFLATMSRAGLLNADCGMRNAEQEKNSK
jgi:ribonuclease P protein component